MHSLQRAEYKSRDVPHTPPSCPFFFESWHQSAVPRPTSICIMHALAANHRGEIANKENALSLQRQPQGELHMFRLSSSPLTRAPRGARGFTIQETLISFCIRGLVTVSGTIAWAIMEENTKPAAPTDLVAHLGLT